MTHEYDLLLRCILAAVTLAYLGAWAVAGLRRWRATKEIRISPVDAAR